MGHAPALCHRSLESLLDDPDKSVVVDGVDIKRERALCVHCLHPVGQHADGATGCALTQDQLSAHREILVSVTRYRDGHSEFTCSSCQQPFPSHSPGAEIEGQVLQ